MEKIRPILYGVADYAQIRKKNAWFVARTAKIRDLESTRYAVFLRPRRFGKSLLLSILEAYYDVAYADRFEQSFAGTDIGAEPTEERNRYLVLYFNFSAVSKDVRQVVGSFEKYTADRFDAFAEKYAKRLPAGLSEKILSSSSAADKMSALFSGMKGVEPGIYCLIDNYRFGSASAPPIPRSSPSGISPGQRTARPSSSIGSSSCSTAATACSRKPCDHIFK